MSIVTRSAAAVILMSIVMLNGAAASARAGSETKETFTGTVVPMGAAGVRGSRPFTLYISRSISTPTRRTTSAPRLRGPSLPGGNRNCSRSWAR
jgi:hypothetical protein